MIRYVTRIVAIGVGLLWLPGCHSANPEKGYYYEKGETLGQTSDEHRQQVISSREQDRRALKEDLDILFQTDRPTRLTRWHSK